VEEESDGESDEGEDSDGEEDQKGPRNLVVVMLEPVAEVEEDGGDNDRADERARPDEMEGEERIVRGLRSEFGVGIRHLAKRVGAESVNS